MSVATTQTNLRLDTETLKGIRLLQKRLAEEAGVNRLSKADVVKIVVSRAVRECLANRRH
jgi:hypothetical protein